MAKRKNRNAEFEDDGPRPDPFERGENDAAERLEEFISQIEGKMMEVEDLQSEIRELYKEAGGQGFETPIIRRVIAEKRKRKKNEEKYERDEQVFTTYMRSLGLLDY